MELSVIVGDKFALPYRKATVTVVVPTPPCGTSQCTIDVTSSSPTMFVGFGSAG